MLETSLRKLFCGIIFAFVLINGSGMKIGASYEIIHRPHGNQRTDRIQLKHNDKSLIKDNQNGGVL